MVIEFNNLKFYDLKETIKILNVSRITIYRYISNGKIKAQKIGGRLYVPEESIKELLKIKD